MIGSSVPPAGPAGGSSTSACCGSSAWWRTLGRSDVTVHDRLEDLDRLARAQLQGLGFLEDHDPPAPYDVAIALSAVEHFGLGHYEAGPPSQDDRAALGRLREQVRPGGRLLLTVPFAAQAGVDAFQRVYDSGGLEELLAGWHVEQRLAAWQVERTQWRLGACAEPLGARGVALVTATRPPAGTT